MYHEDEGSVDVELLAECGAIAQRLRSLERTWVIDLKDLQKGSLQSFGRPPLPSSLSATQKLNEIFDGNEHVDNNEHRNDPEFENRLRHLENSVIKIHCQEELLKETGEQKRATTTSNRKVHIKSNMNYSAAATKSNNNDLTTSPTGIHELRDDQQPLETHSHPCTTPGDVVSSSVDNNNKSLMNDDAESEKDLSQANCSDSNKQSANVYHHHQHQCGRVHESDLRMLLRELKRKVDFTEKMNWLCKSPQALFEFYLKFIAQRPAGSPIYDPKAPKLLMSHPNGGQIISPSSPASFSSNFPPLESRPRSNK